MRVMPIFIIILKLSLREGLLPKCKHNSMNCGSLRLLPKRILAENYSLDLFTL